MDAEEVGSVGEGLDAWRSWIGGEVVDQGAYPAQAIAGQFAELTTSGGTQVDTVVGHCGYS